jgi:hypothetical protein
MEPGLHLLLHLVLALFHLGRLGRWTAMIRWFDAVRGAGVMGIIILHREKGWGRHLANDVMHLRIIPDL